jgi:hypothetical protein
LLSRHIAKIFASVTGLSSTKYCKEITLIKETRSLEIKNCMPNLSQCEILMILFRRSSFRLWQFNLVKNKPCIEWPICGVERDKWTYSHTRLGLNQQSGRHVSSIVVPLVNWFYFIFFYVHHSCPQIAHHLKFHVL